MKYGTIIWDLDGTLLDTLADLTASTNAALAAFGYPARTLEQVRQVVGNGAANQIRKSLPEDAGAACAAAAQRIEEQGIPFFQKPACLAQQTLLLAFIQVALKHGKLGMQPKLGKQAVHLSPYRIAVYVISHDNVHGSPHAERNIRFLLPLNDAAQGPRLPFHGFAIGHSAAGFLVMELRIQLF